MNIFARIRFKALSDKGARPMYRAEKDPVDGGTIALPLAKTGVDAKRRSSNVETAPPSWPEICTEFSRAALNRGNVKVLSEEKLQVLAERNGWSLDRTKGYVDGENFRQRGRKPSQYALVGIDEYSLGFRAGYYERRNGASTVKFSGAAEERTSVKV